MTLQDLLSSLYRKLNYASTPSTDVTVRLTGFLNEIHRRIMGLPGMGVLRHTQSVFTSDPGTSQYSLLADVSRVMAIRDTTNNVTLTGRPWEWYTRTVPDPSDTTGVPVAWAPMGMVGYVNQPTTACKVYVASSSALDTTQTAYVEGVDNSGRPLSSSTMLTGATLAQVGMGLGVSRLGEFQVITEFHLSHAAVGLVVVTNVAESVNYSFLTPGETYARFLRIALWPAPADYYTYTIDYERKLDDLMQPMDQPIIPEDFHWLIEAGAKMLEYEKTNDSRYSVARSEYEKGIRDLRWFVTQQADGSDQVAQVPSQLGAWYPAGS